MWHVQMLKCLWHFESCLILIPNTKCKALQYQKIDRKQHDLSIIKDFISQTEIGSNTDYLLYELPLVLGCKYILSKNLYGQLGIDLGLVNGATVILKHIITNEIIDLKAEVIQLISMPKLLIVQLINRNESCDFNLSDLPKDHFYIEPSSVQFSLKVGNQKFTEGSSTKKHNNYYRIQFPLNPAFAVTSYKIQSKTKEKLIIDLVAPDNAIYNNDAYVKLGRVKTLEGVKILRTFLMSDLNRPKHKDIDKEINRLTTLSNETIHNYELLKKLNLINN